MTDDTERLVADLRSYELHAFCSEHLHRLPPFLNQQLGAPEDFCWTDGFRLLDQAVGGWLLWVTASRALHDEPFSVWLLRRVENGTTAIDVWSDEPYHPESRLLCVSVANYELPKKLDRYEFWVENHVALLKNER